MTGQSSRFERIVALAAQGASNREIAAVCGCTTRTLCRARAADPLLNELILAARREFAAANPPPHGVRRYKNWGCRCDVCRAGNTAQHLVWAQRRRGLATVVSVPVVSRVEEIEQAIARGEPTVSIMGRFGCEYAAVKTIRDGMLEGAA